MADHYGAAGKVLETILQGADGVDIHVVSRLVQKQYIAFVLEGQGQMQPVPFTSGENSAEFLLVGSAEIESRDPCAGIDVAIPKTHPFGVAGYGFVDRLVRIYAFVLLVYVGDLDSLSDVDRT